MRLRPALVTIPRRHISWLRLLEPSYCSSCLDAFSAQRLTTSTFPPHIPTSPSSSAGPNPEFFTSSIAALGLPALCFMWLWDNSVQHWLYFCPVPALTGSLLLRTPWKTSNWFLQETFSAFRLAVIAGLWVSARQFIHERSGLLPPSLDLPPATSDTIPQLAIHLAHALYRTFPLLTALHTSTLQLRPVYFPPAFSSILLFASDLMSLRPFQYSTVLLRFSITILQRRRELAPSLPIPLRFANYFYFKNVYPDALTALLPLGYVPAATSTHICTHFNLSLPILPSM